MNFGLASKLGKRLPWATLPRKFMEGASLDNDVFSKFITGTRSSTCWSRDWDFSGVAWSNDVATAYGDSRRCHLIGRKSFVAAQHWGPVAGDVVAFIDVDGAQQTYTVDAHTQIGSSDIKVGTFTGTVAATLTSYAIDEDVNVSDWLVATRSRDVTPTTASQKTQIEKVSVVTTSAVAWTADMFDDVAARRSVADTYDSGDAVFSLNKDGTLSLVSTYTGPTTGPHYGDATTLGLIDAWLTTQSTTRATQTGVPA